MGQAIGHSQASHRQALGQVSGSIVYARENVSVYIDHHF
jgi:hypothetical protein